jgi:hypothetical protein
MAFGLMITMIAAVATGEAAPGCPCGCPMSPAGAELEAALKHEAMLESFAAPRSDEIITIPLALHVVRRSDGTGGIALAYVEQALEDANAGFASVGFVFCQKGDIIYVDDDAHYYDIDTLYDINRLRAESVVENAINVYFTPNLVYNGNQICGISSFSYSPVQGVVMHNACTGVPHNPSTFPHELGHYFDLYHTYETAFAVECPDGSNCGTAGDKICDTPADPLMNLSDINELCRWEGSTPPPCGIEPYRPSPRNFMAYSITTCRDKFTAGQAEKMRAVLYAARPELVDAVCDECPWDTSPEGGDDSVGLGDLNALLSNWGLCPAPCLFDFAPEGGDGTVGLGDLNALLSNWGPCP